MLAAPDHQAPHKESIVHDVAGSPLAAWESFYVIVGSSAAALTGLQFVVIAAAVVLRRHTVVSLFAVGAAALLLLFVGIHNAWDAVTYIAIDHVQAHDVTREKR